MGAFLREMKGLEGQAAFENVVSKFKFMRCIRQGSVEALALWLKLAKQILWNVEKDFILTNCRPCTCRNEGSSFVSVEGWKEVPKLCLGPPSLDFSSNRRSSTGYAFFMQLLSSCSNVKPRHLRL